MRDSLAQYNKLNANVVGISVDGPFAIKAFKNANNLNFTLSVILIAKPLKHLETITKTFPG